MTDAHPSIGFVGPGRLAASLAAALLDAGYPVVAVAGREPSSARVLADALGRGVRAASAPAEALLADVVVLAVPDGAIASVAAALPWEPRHRVVHCSGATGLDVLAPVIAAGGFAGCLHPLQSFPSRAPQPERLRGITCGVEGAGELGVLLEQIVRDVGARSVRLEGVDRAGYHAAAVFASNYVVALMHLAQRTWTDAGLPEATAREALAPLLRAVAENVGRLDLAQALTGPVARGDVATVEAHLAALGALPDVQGIYRDLGAELLRLPLALPDEVRRALEQRLRPRSP